MYKFIWVIFDTIFYFLIQNNKLYVHKTEPKNLTDS